MLGYLAVFLAETKAQVTIQLPTNSTRKNALLPGVFHVSSIFDERAGPDSIGTLLFRSNELSIMHKIPFQSGTLKGISKILTDSFARDTSSRPLSIRIKVCNIKENLTGIDRVKGEISLILLFDLEKESGSVPLTQYRSTARYTRLLNNLNTVDATLQNVLGNSLTFINSWINTEASTNPAFSHTIELSFSDYLEQHQDTVYYHPLRPLIWDDFQEKRSGGRFAASVFPSFGYDQRSKIENGVLKVELVMKVFVVKSASWVGAGTMGNYSLKHEQRHFDLVKIVAERFEKKLLSEKLTPDNYQGIVNFEYLEFYREMNKIQQEYDDQTSHGTSAILQEFWNRKIEAELKLVQN